MDANHLELRNELEFCFAEAVLNLGLDYISDALLEPNVSDWETTWLNFYHEYATHDWEWPDEGNEELEFEPPRTQGPRREESETPRSLFTTLLERLSEVTPYRLSDVKAEVELDLDESDHPLAYLNPGGKGRLLQGKNL